VAEIQAVCEKWELAATPVGSVTDDGLFRVVHDGLLVAAIHGGDLVEACPIYHPEAAESPAAVARRAATPSTPAPTPEIALERLLDAPCFASKRWVFEQCDSTVRAATVLGPGGDAGLLAVPGATFGVAVTIDCNSRYVALDPYEGGKATVAEAARNIACTGARPLGITDCLNFGNPEKPEVFFQFREACRGIADACRAFDTPVTGGNVSLYNENPTGAIDPTPTIGMIGLLDDLSHRVASHFQQPGDAIALLGASRGHLGGSTYWAEVRNAFCGDAPPVDLDAERRLQEFLVAAAAARLLRSAHDLSDGGLAGALAECCIGGPYADRTHGAAVDLSRYAPSLTSEELLFGEDHGRVVITHLPSDGAALAALAQTQGVPWHAVGLVDEAGGALRVQTADTTHVWETSRLRQIYMDAIPRRMRQVAPSGLEH
jgi:phosphoribosylformylglycinamidine synthase